MEIECIYTKGVLKPLKKLKLKEGEKVKIKLEEKDELESLRGKYGVKKLNILKIKDEIYDRRSFHR